MRLQFPVARLQLEVRSRLYVYVAHFQCCRLSRHALLSSQTLRCVYQETPLEVEHDAGDERATEALLQQ